MLAQVVGPGRREDATWPRPVSQNNKARAQRKSYPRELSNQAGRRLSVRVRTRMKTYMFFSSALRSKPSDGLRRHVWLEPCNLINRIPSSISKFHLSIRPSNLVLLSLSQSVLWLFSVSLSFSLSLCHVSLFLSLCLCLSTCLSAYPFVCLSPSVLPSLSLFAHVPSNLSQMFHLFRGSSVILYIVVPIFLVICLLLSTYLFENVAYPHVHLVIYKCF